MTRGRDASGAAYARFKKALQDIADNPSPASVVRYLAASRALDDARANPG